MTTHVPKKLSSKRLGCPIDVHFKQWPIQGRSGGRKFQILKDSERTNLIFFKGHMYKEYTHRHLEGKVNNKRILLYKKVTWKWKITSKQREYEFNVPVLESFISFAFAHSLICRKNQMQKILIKKRKEINKCQTHNFILLNYYLKNYWNRPVEPYYGIYHQSQWSRAWI